jgi:hypothetical protein
MIMKIKIVVKGPKGQNTIKEKPKITLRMPTKL